MSVALKVEWLQQQVVKERAKRSYVTADMKTRGLPAAHTKPVHTQTLHFNDPVWSSLWYFVSRIFYLLSSWLNHRHINSDRSWNRSWIILCSHCLLHSTALKSPKAAGLTWTSLQPGREGIRGRAWWCPSSMTALRKSIPIWSQIM